MILLIANKIDMYHETAVARQEVEKYATDEKIILYHVTANDRKLISDALALLVTKLHNSNKSSFSQISKKVKSGGMQLEL